MKRFVSRISHSTGISRRTFAGRVAAFGVLAGLCPVPFASAAAPAKRPGRLQQAVCKGVFKGANLDFDGMCREAARLGAVGIDLVGPEEFATLEKHGLVPTMVRGGGSIKQGINDKKNHAAIEPQMLEFIKAAGQAKARNVIVLAGDRAGISDEEGLENSVVFLKKVIGAAEDNNVTLCLELLNSKVNHPGYMADSTKWGVKLCQQVGSPRMKLLYDIYHMQIMEGDVIRTIQQNIKYIGHFHTAGNPGRHEFGPTQELNYPGICRAIADLNFDGYLAHEYTPTTDPLKTLDEMMRLCEV